MALQMTDVTLDRIEELAENAATDINNKLELGTTGKDHRTIKAIVSRTIARALAEQRAISQ